MKGSSKQIHSCPICIKPHTNSVHNTIYISLSLKRKWYFIRHSMKKKNMSHLITQRINKIKCISYNLRPDFQNNKRSIFPQACPRARAQHRSNYCPRQLYCLYVVIQFFFVLLLYIKCKRYERDRFTTCVSISCASQALLDQQFTRPIIILVKTVLLNWKDTRVRAHRFVYECVYESMFYIVYVYEHDTWHELNFRKSKYVCYVYTIIHI